MSTLAVALRLDMPGDPMVCGNEEPPVIACPMAAMIQHIGYLPLWSYFFFYIMCHCFYNVHLTTYTTYSTSLTLLPEADEHGVSQKLCLLPVKRYARHSKRAREESAERKIRVTF